tara:strand:- start:613 stop:1332 length:720 start_codon:yes stop_codon:yes gene_type:complete
MENLEEQSLSEHLSDLRKALLWSILFITIGFAASFSQSELIFDFARKPIEPFIGQGLVFTGVMDKFIAHIKVSILAGIILSSPFWLYQVWNFISPALYKNEKRYAVVFLSVGTLLFLAGCAFVYYLVYPLAFDFLLSFAGQTDSPMITIDKYISFFLTTSLAFGFMFELPLVLTLLGMLGVIDADFLVRYRRYAIVILALGSALVTPPDVISMAMMMVPMILLYEASVLSVRMFAKKKS